MRFTSGSHAHAQSHLRRSLNHASPVGQEHTATRVARDLYERTPTQDNSESSSTCQPGNHAAICEKPAGTISTQTLPIILGAVIPICCALVVFVILHRRYLRKQKIEDETYKHRSLDFGMGEGGSGKDLPEMTITDLGSGMTPGGASRHGKGVSLDVMSPYLLPGNLQDSRESLHSLTRSIQDEHDPYRPVTQLRDIAESPRHRFADNGSIYSTETGPVSLHERSNLVTNAQRMSQSLPKPYPAQEPELPTPHDSKAPSDEFMLPDTPLPQIEERALPNPPPPETFETHIPPGGLVEETIPPARSSSVRNGPRPMRKDSLRSARNNTRESSNYGDVESAPPMPMPPIPVVNEPQPEDTYDIDPSMIHTGHFSIDAPGPAETLPVVNNRLSVMGVRPLPPDSLLAEDNAEQRANRIRSFYKEYFDDSKPDPDGAYTAQYDDYFDGAIYDETTGQFVMATKPFAQAPGRRAMTPPPRGAASMPRLHGDNPHRRQFSTMSHARGRPPPKKALPPPKPLQGLPTPSKLNIDTALGNSIDFAPPSSFRDVQNGRGTDSPLGSLRPFSPAVRPFTPLVSSYDDLTVMPSPHLLRKSGTFTALDFAPPRLCVQDVHSDAGSIRSARSGISAMQIDAVRAGAYRVSRIPKEVVTTREDLTAQLRPRLNMVTPA